MYVWMYVWMYVYLSVCVYTKIIETYIYIYTYIHTLHYITLHCITLHYITLHYITLHCIALHYITLHYIHTYINIWSIWLYDCICTNKLLWYFAGYIPKLGHKQKIEVPNKIRLRLTQLPSQKMGVERQTGIIFGTFTVVLPHPHTNPTFLVFIYTNHAKYVENIIYTILKTLWCLLLGFICMYININIYI